MQHQPLGDEIHGDVSDGKSAAIGKGINQHEQNVNVNFPPPWNPSQGHGQGEGLSMAAEQRLDTEIRKLRDLVSEMNAGIVALTLQLKFETDSRKERTESQERIVNTLADGLKAQIMAITVRINELELLAAGLARQRGQRDPVIVTFASVITLVLIVIAWALIRSGGI